MEYQHSSPTIGPADITLPPTSAIDLTWLLTDTDTSTTRERS